MPTTKPDQLKPVGQLQFEGAWPTAVAFIDDQRVAAGNRDGQILVWDISNWPEVAAGDKPADQAAPTPSAPTPTRLLAGHSNGISRLVSGGDGRHLISASLDHSLRLWDVSDECRETTQIILDRTTREKSARKRPESERQALLEAPGVTVNVQSSAAVLEGHRDWVNALGVSGNGKRLISGDARSKVIVWDLDSAQKIAEWSGHPWNGVVAADLTPDGLAAVVSEFTYKRDDFDIPAPALKLWDVAQKTERLDILKTHIPKLDATATTYSAASAWRKFVKGGLIALDVSPDGQLVAIGQGGETDTGQVHLFELETGKLVRTVSGHRYGVCDVKFSPDGQYVVSSGRDTQLRICRVANGDEIAALGESRGGQFKDWLSALAISPQQRHIAAADIAGYVHVWEWNPS